MQSVYEFKKGEVLDEKVISSRNINSRTGLVCC